MRKLKQKIVEGDKIVKFKELPSITNKYKKARYKVIGETELEYILVKIGSFKREMTIPKELMIEVM